jgi:hypothetical protein
VYVGEKGMSFKVLVEKCEGNDCCKDLCMGGRLMLKELGWEGVDRFYQGEDTTNDGPF